MPDYRLYWIDDGGHFFRAERFEAENDARAIEQARALSRGEAVELWCGARKIMTFRGTGRAAT